MKLEARGIRVRRGGFELGATFATPASGVTVVFGPSGAGKSMLLAAIAGFNRLEAGLIALGEKVLEDAGVLRVAPHRRDVGLVFQDARLFPHLTVRGNLNYAQTRAPKDRTGAGAGMGLEEMARQLEIESMLDRPVRNLSGGEKSRVALGRALISAPALLLLDEPFAALDGRRRRAFLALLAEVSQTRKLPMIVVTHQIEDAAEIADFMLALKGGAIVAAAPAGDAMRQPEFLSLLDARDVGARIDASMIDGASTRARGVWVRADQVLISIEPPRGLSARNVWEGKVARLDREADGSILAWIDTRAGPIPARITPAAAQELLLAQGKPAWAVVKTHAI